MCDLWTGPPGGHSQRPPRCGGIPRVPIGLPVFFFEGLNMGPACMMGMPVPQDFKEMMSQKSTRLESLAGTAPENFRIPAAVAASHDCRDDLEHAGLIVGPDRAVGCTESDGCTGIFTDF